MSNENDQTEREVSDKLPELARGIEKVLTHAAGVRRGFLLLTFPFDREGGDVQYISNADRRDTIKVLRKHLELWEAGMPDVPYTQKQ